MQSWKNLTADHATWGPERRSPLPLLDVMETPTLLASPMASPVTRACYLYIPNGVANGAWEPEKVSNDGKLEKLNSWMAPLQDFKDDLIVPRKMWTPRGNGHGAGTATWLTGHGYNGRKIDSGGPSADQIAAKAIGQATLLPSLELSTKGEGYFSNSLVAEHAFVVVGNQAGTARHGATRGLR